MRRKAKATGSRREERPARELISRGAWAQRVTKLANIQKLLEARGLADQINTAAITYDPAFNLPERLRGYGQNRGVRLDTRHRMLGTIDGVSALCSHFNLGVNFIESLVNRHRIEAYILDAEGRIAASFERIHWMSSRLWIVQSRC